MEINGDKMSDSKAAFSRNPIHSSEEGLLHLKRSYQLKQVELIINRHKINLAKVCNIDDLLERAVSADEIPFWAELWPSSIGLAQYILENEKEFQGKNLLELGSGVGLGGIAAKLAGSRVTQSDFSIEALKFTEVNCLQNRVSADKLLLADWRNFPTEINGFEWIIGADILYEKTLHYNLESIFNQALEPEGIVLLADPGRNYAKNFMVQITSSGWQVKKYTYPVLYEERTYSVDIYQLQRGGTG
jgi:predicted nicotinamide N-methyase